MFPAETETHDKEPVKFCFLTGFILCGRQSLISGGGRLSPISGTKALNSCWREAPKDGLQEMAGSWLPGQGWLWLAKGRCQVWVAAAGIAEGLAILTQSPEAKTAPLQVRCPFWTLHPIRSILWHAYMGISPTCPHTAELANGCCPPLNAQQLQPEDGGSQLPEQQRIPGAQSTVALRAGPLPHCSMDTGGRLVPAR